MTTKNTAPKPTVLFVTACSGMELTRKEAAKTLRPCYVRTLKREAGKRLYLCCDSEGEKFQILVTR